MSSFVPAVAEQRFVLSSVADLDELAATERFAAAADDMVKAVLEGVGRFAVGEWAPLARTGDTVGAKWTEAGVKMPEGFVAAYQAYVEAGWGALGVPEQFGGQGMPFALATAVLETLGTANAGFALAPMLTVGAVEALSHHGSAEQQQVYLPKLATGEWTGTMNLTEPQAGSDVGALKAMAEPRSDGTWSLRGTKIFISFGDHDMAENIVHLVLARTPGAPAGTKGLSLFLVPKYRLDPRGNPGEPNDIRVLSIEHKLGLHASPTCVLSFGDNGQCIGELIGAEGGGIAAMFTMMNNARLNVGLEGVQVAEAATQRAVGYARERIQSARAGSPDRKPVAIIEHPDVRRMLLRMKAQTQAARALVYYAAGQVDRAALGDQEARWRVDLVTPLVKTHATDIGCEVSSLGIQVHGGMGYIEETGAAQHFRDARIFPIYEGTNGIQAADFVGRKLGLDNGGVFERFFSNIGAEARHDALRDVAARVLRIGRAMIGKSADDRLAASYPFTTMAGIATCGWLMEKQLAALDGFDAGAGFAAMKRASADFYLDQIVPEALGLEAAATASAGILYSVPAEAFAG